ncbi:hypothetical protein [Nocardioides taihuensis]|uniref:Phage baseplate protein n=1 Tax=Nocardioides taihuensis TaxID=1835606 RepID=A0ABW0BDD0_9ACTN
MSQLTPATVLELWEAGLGSSPAARADLLLVSAVADRRDDRPADDVEDWPVGTRDRALLEHYCPRRAVLDAVADCPACGSALDVAVDAQALVAESSPGPVTVDVDGHRVVVRAVTVGDLRAVPAGGSPEALRDALLERCVVRATYDGSEVPPDQLPPAVVERIESTLDELDPTGDLEVVLTCEDCGERWSETLDPVRFAWAALESSARRLATDVHTLARAYGWREQDILALSAFRRHLYLSALEP